MFWGKLVVRIGAFDEGILLVPKCFAGGSVSDPVVVPLVDVLYGFTDGHKATENRGWNFVIKESEDGDRSRCDDYKIFSPFEVALCGAAFRIVPPDLLL